MADPEIKITFKADSTAVDKDLERIEQKIEKLPKRIPLGQGTLSPNGPNATNVPNGSKNPLKEEYEAGYKELQEELSALSERYAVLLEQSEELTKSYQEELANLEENVQGYADKKKALEDLIAKGEGYERTLTSQKAAADKMALSSQQLNERISKIGYQKAIQEQDKMGLSLGVLQKTFDQSEQQISNYADAWVNKLAKASEKAIKSEETYQSTLELTGKTYQELTQLYSQLLAQRQRGDLTPEQLQKIDRQLTAVRKNITLMGREAQLSGAKMIGAQTSVVGVMQQVISQWRNGTLTLKGLTQGIKLFAKSTAVLAAIQFAWEGISWAMEKAKTALFGTAEAEEIAAQKAEELAKAAKTASDNLAAAQAALRASRADKARDDAAREFADLIKAQNDEYREQIKLVDEALAANLRLAAATAKDEEKDIALEKLRLQEEKMKGLIAEYDYQERLVKLEARSAKNRRDSDIAQKQSVVAAEAERVKLARKSAAEAESMALKEEGLTPEELNAMVKQYMKDEATIQQYEELYKERKKLKEAKKQGEALRAEGRLYEATLFERHSLPGIEKRLTELNEVLHEVDGLINRSTQMYANLPDLIKDAQTLEIGLAEYAKDYKARVKHNEDVRKQQKKAREDAARAEDALAKAQSALEIANADAADAATREAELTTQRIGMIRWQRDNEKENEKNEKKIAAYKKKAQDMELSALKQRADELDYKAINAGAKTPAGQRFTRQADVFRDEYNRRLDKAKNTAEKAIQGKYASSQAEQNVINQAAGLLEKIAAREEYTQKDFKKAAALLDRATKTTGAADDSVVQSLVNFMSSTATAIDKQRKQNAKLGRAVEQLRNKLSDPSR